MSVGTCKARELFRSKKQGGNIEKAKNEMKRGRVLDCLIFVQCRNKKMDKV